MHIKTFGIYGPPGTGKTTEMIRRIGDLSDAYKPTEIAFMSHTKAAAEEARARAGEVGLHSAGTIHSMCFRLLGLSRSMVIDHKRVKAFADGIGVPVRGGSVDDNDQIEVGDEYLAIYNLAISTFRKPEEVFAVTHCNGTWDQCRYFIDRYLQWKSKSGLIDFNDMLLRYAYEPHPTGAAVLMVDEAQDLSPLQWQVIQAMTDFRQMREVHIAGDDDQAIFVWGGADPQGMVRFEEANDSERVVLPISYRIPRSVHALANRIVQRIPDRVPKDYAPRDEQGTISEHSDWYGIQFKKGQSTMLLARTGARKREIERMLVGDSVPFLTEGGFPGPLQNRTAKALRSLNALRRGESIDQNEMLNLKSQLTAKAQEKAMPDQDSRTLALDRVFDWPQERVVNIPPWYARYYDNVDVEAPASVRLMTIHAAKGREADRVIIDSALSQRVVMGMVDDPASEARVQYVGVTRARHQLDIIAGINGYEYSS